MSDHGDDLDPRVARGMRQLLDQRRERLEAGERPLGWKLGVGTKAAMEKVGIDRPLVGFLTDRSLVQSGAGVAIGDWTTPTLEPEVAVHLEDDVHAGASREEVQAAVAGFGPAIELVDLDPPPEDPETILAGNIFHRHVVLGPVDREQRSGEGIGLRVIVGEEEAAATEDAQEQLGELLDLVRVVADTLGACGERLTAGSVIITGSAVPAIGVSPGDEVRVEVDPLGTIGVSLR